MYRKVNSASDFNENLVKNAKFRLVGVPPDVAGELVDIDFSKDIESAKRDVLRAYNLNPIVDIQFIFKGKVITELSQLKKLGFNPKKDMITVMASQSAGAYNSREARIRELILDGLSEKDIIREVGSRTILESDFMQFYDTTKLMNAKAEIIRPLLEDALRNGYGEDKLYQIFRDEGYDFMLPSQVPGSVSRFDRLDMCSQIIWQISYKEMLMNRYKVKQLRVLDPNTNIHQTIRPLSSAMIYKLNNLDPFSGSIDYNIDELIGIFDIKNVLDTNNIQQTDYDTIWIEHGEHNYHTNIKGDGFIHFVAQHLNQFKDWGIKTPKQLLEFVIKTVSEGTAVEVDPNRHRIAYKLMINGEVEYLVIGLDHDKSIHTLFPAGEQNKRTYVQWSSIFDQYIITYSGKVI